MPELWPNPNPLDNPQICLTFVRQKPPALIPAYDLSYFNEEILMKNLFLSLSVAAISLGLSGVASATCVQEGQCFDSYQGIEIGGASYFGGFGAGVFNGESGGVTVNKTGYGFTETTMNVGGDLCGVDCQSGSFTFTGAAGEMVDVSSTASGGTPGETVSAVNEGAAFSGVSFNFGKFNLSGGN